MVSLFAIVALGFLLGMRHATDPDHVVAVTTIVSRERNLKQAALIGVAWGAGHTLTLLSVGSAMILFRIVLPPRVGLGMELAVAVMLVLLGLRNMGGLFESAARQGGMSTIAPAAHDHAHDDSTPIHGSAPAGAHEHDLRWLDRWFGRTTVYQVMRPLLVGIVHGLAGSAAIALLVLGTIQSFRWAVVYLLVFGVGTILGMMLITMTLASAFFVGRKRFGHVGRYFGFATGVASLAFGLLIAYRIGFVDGLFTAHATWFPR